MQLKENVNMSGLKIQMRRALIIADRIWAENGQELVVTSATDGEHTAGSLHYYGYALDFRTRYFEKPILELLIVDLAKTLRKADVAYRTVVHDTHIHVEWRGAMAPQIEGNPALIDLRS